MSKTQEKKVMQGNVLDFFLLDTLKTRFWMKNLTERWTHSTFIFPKSRQFFFIFQKSRGGLHTPLLVDHLCVAEYASISLNITKCPWKCWNKLFFTRALNMPDHLTCMAGCWRCLVFWMCQDSEYAMAAYARVIQNFEYV